VTLGYNATREQSSVHSHAPFGRLVPILFCLCYDSFIAWTYLSVITSQAHITNHKKVYFRKIFFVACHTHRIQPGMGILFLSAFEYLDSLTGINGTFGVRFELALGWNSKIANNPSIS
jgi:hypothetical protein